MILEVKLYETRNDENDISRRSEPRKDISARSLPHE